ncbi:hypothetical protein CAPTEDRAFT_193244 [Capitella teleta]|uniref:Uncharacterized protein n=1 Tax=Capitella teleta TaxID=283909 RepID=R7UQV0_CAPTE|nr:hypothetical protein CAPTEDRAFT_193244 [Capitella teleta]|eukprot:ELU05796.1 hypothetical protein CAPTEDRAFT_193244 [Capitella teleta]
MIRRGSSHRSAATSRGNYSGGYTGLEPILEDGRSSEEHHPLDGTDDDNEGTRIITNKHAGQLDRSSYSDHRRATYSHVDSMYLPFSVMSHDAKLFRQPRFPRCNLRSCCFVNRKGKVRKRAKKELQKMIQIKFKILKEYYGRKTNDMISILSFTI